MYLLKALKFLQLDSSFSESNLSPFSKVNPISVKIIIIFKTFMSYFQILQILDKLRCTKSSQNYIKILATLKSFFLKFQILHIHTIINTNTLNQYLISTNVLLKYSININVLPKYSININIL